jgi:uncharacterized protein (TIGR03083 family)
MTASSTSRTARRARLWAMIRTERAALAADLAGLGDEEWAARSLCSEFTVRQVLAHLTAGATISPARWMAGVIKCRFDFDKQLVLRLNEQLGASPAETLERFGRAVANTSSPVPLKAMLGETIVHGEDIRRPLGLSRTYPVETVTLLAEYYRGSDFVVVARKRVVDLRLEADDGPFASGSGPLVSGPTIALTMAMTGRAAFCDDLKGDGVPILRERCATMG